MARIGAIRYLNAMPLVAGLEDDPVVGPVRYEVPSLLAQDLRSGALELALVPQVEALHDPEYRIVPRLCIACDGPVRSILLFRRRAFHELRRIGVDSSSQSSSELLRVLIHRARIAPELVFVSPRLDPLRSKAPALDAVLLIGDRALAEDHGEFERTDLGEMWRAETGLPFVFALWIGRMSVERTLIGAVQSAARRGLACRAELAAAFCREHPEVIEPAAATEYLTHSIRYDLGNAELESMIAFHRYRAEAGLAPRDAAEWRPRFFEAVP